MKKPGAWVHLWVLCLVQIALWTVPCLSVNLGDSCTSDNNCTVANSTCTGTGSTCACEATHYQVNFSLCAERIPVGQNCTGSTGSQQNCVTGAVCDTGNVCRIPVGQNCTGSTGSQQNCVTGAVCDTGNVCRIPVGQNCTGSTGSQQNCVTGAVCDTGNVCRIPVGQNCTGSTGSQQNCVTGAVCDTGNICRIPVGQNCTGSTGSQQNCVTGAVCDTGNVCRIPVGQNCTGSTGSQQNCVTGAVCDTGNVCRIPVGQNCTGSTGSQQNCVTGAVCDTGNVCRIPVGQSCTGSTGSQQNCVTGAVCDTGNICRYRVGEKCTAHPADLCQQGSECINLSSSGSIFKCRITAGSTLNCNSNSSLCVTSAVCETSTCKTKVNQPCTENSKSCETNTTCANGAGGFQCRRTYGSDCANSDECLKTQNQDCLSYGGSSNKCLCSQGYFRQSPSNTCQNASLLIVGNLHQDGNKMETSVMVAWAKPGVLGGGDAEYSAKINSGQWSSWSGGLTASFNGLTPGEKSTVSVRTRTKKDPAYGNTTVTRPTPQELSVLTKPAKPGKLSSGILSLPNVTLKFKASNGTVEYYIVTVTPNGGTQNVSSPSVTFSNLMARAYNVTIVAYSHGIMSDAQIDNFTVDAARAGAVTGLNAAQVGSRWSKVTWHKPVQPNGDIMGYTVRILFKNDSCATGVAVLCSDCGSVSETPSVAECTEKSSITYTKDELNSKSREFQVNGTALQPDVSYKVRVNAYNQKGQGVDEETDTTTLQEAAPNLKDLTLAVPRNREVLVTWVPGERTGPTNYSVSWSEKQSLSSNVFMPKGSVVITGYEQTQHSITENLLSYWEYKVSVFPYTPVGPPAHTMTKKIRTAASEPAKVQFDIIKLPDSAERVNLTAQCPGEKERNGPITFISFNSTVTTQGAYEKNAPSGSIPVTESNCAGFQLVDVAAEASYLFTVFARTSSLSGVTSTQIVTIDAKRPKLEKPPGVSALVEGGESKTRSVTIEVCPCVTSCKQGRIHMAGLLVCIKSATEQCQPERATTKSKYESFKTWKSFMKDQKGSYRLDFPNSTLQGCGRAKRSTEQFVPFIIGGDNTCDQKDEKYCNGPLPAGREFAVIVWACTSAGCSEAEGASVKTLAEEDSTATGVIIGAVVSILVIAVIVAVVVVLVLRHKQKFCFSKYDHPEPNGYSPPVRRPVKLRDFAAHLDRLHKDSNLLFQEEFEDIQDRSPKHFPQEAALLDANKVKNRYVNILPFDHTRVKLSTDDDDETSDFINANYIPGYTSPREYIATQGPMVGTFADFWKMLWEQKSSLIVMLSDLQEKGRPKVDMYWPGDLHSPVQYDDIVVELTTTSTLNKYTIRTFSVYKEDQKEETRQVAQYFIPGWEDFSANLGPDHVLDFISSTRLEARNSQGPIIVHCSAGVGRTGTFIALDFLMQYVREHSLDDSVDIYNLVLNMRHNRPFMVQSEKQYIFIHDTLKVIIERKMREEEEHVYGNTSLDDIYVNQAFEPEENLYENTGFSPTTSL